MHLKWTPPFVPGLRRYGLSDPHWGSRHLCQVLWTSIQYQPNQLLCKATTSRDGKNGPLRKGSFHWSDPPNLTFWNKTREIQKTKKPSSLFSLWKKNLKSLEKEGETEKKARIIGKRKKQGNRTKKKTRARGSGLSRKWLDSPLFSTIWRFSKISRMSKFSGISRNGFFWKDPF